MSNVLIEQDGPVTIITINRPDRRNAVDSKTAVELFDAFSEFDLDEQTSVFVLTGAEGAFCAGFDLKSLAEGGAAAVTQDGVDSLGPMGPTRMRLSKPVIAAIEGYAVAGGMELALWCDLRVMAETATLGVFCRRFGVPLIDMGTIRLPRLIGHARAMDLILTGRPVDAREALSFGLANRVAPAGEARAHAVALAKDIATFPQACLRNDRLSALEQWSLEEDDAIANEVRRGLDTIKSGETQAGAGRFSGGEGRGGKFE